MTILPEPAETCVMNNMLHIFIGDDHHKMMIMSLSFYPAVAVGCFVRYGTNGDIPHYVSRYFRSELYKVTTGPPMEREKVKYPRRLYATWAPAQPA